MHRIRSGKGSRGIAILILNLGARRLWVDSATPRPLYPRETPGTHCTGGCVGPRAGLDRSEKSHPKRVFFARVVYFVSLEVFWY
jgi:hypothetical protein